MTDPRAGGVGTLAPVRTVVVGEPPPELQAWLDRRRELGQDLFDEVWEGEYHVAPGPNAGHGDVDHQLALILGARARAAGLRGSGPVNIGASERDFRVPDQAYFRDRPASAFVPTAAIVVEVVSPHDETWQKLGFYHRHGVEELLVVDPLRRSVTWLLRAADAFVEADASALLGIAAEDLRSALDWPPGA